MNIFDIVEKLEEKSIFVRCKDKEESYDSPHLYFSGNCKFSNNFIEKLKSYKINLSNTYNYGDYILYNEYKIEFSSRQNDLARIYFTSLKKCIQDFQIPFDCLFIKDDYFKDPDIAKYLAELPLEFM